MSPATDLAALFIRFAAEGRDVAWLADEFLVVAGRARHVHVTRDPDRTAAGLYCRVDAPAGCGEAVVPDQRAFRPLLARLAKVYATERGTDLLPYGGRLMFDRYTADGPVQIDVVFANTLGAQYLTLTTRSARRPCRATGAIAIYSLFGPQLDCRLSRARPTRGKARRR